MEESSSKIKKRKRGRSLIFKSLLPLSGSTHESAHASDDNLVYCDISNNGPNGEASTKTKSASTRGRMSTIFKAVLFDTAMKKRMRGKKPSKTTTTPSTNPSSVLDKKTNKSFNENNQNVEKVSETDNNSNIVKASEENNNPNVVKVLEKDKNNTNIEKVSETDNNTNVVKVSETDNNPNTVKVSDADNNSTNESSKVVSMPSKTDVSSVASSTADNGSQTPTKKKVMSRVNSNTKKPPLPSGSRPQVKPTIERDSKPATSNNSRSRLYLLIVLLVILLVVLWMRFRTTLTESSNLDSDLHTDMTVVVGDEL